MYWLVRLAAFLARLAPLRVSYALARAAGAGAYYAWPGGRRRAVRNLLRVVDGDEHAARCAARRSFENYAVYLVDFLRLVGAQEHDIKRRVQFENWEQLESERNGNGIVFVTMHFGNWDMGAATLALHGFPISAVADRFADERMNRLVIRSREHLGMRVIPVDRMGPGILRALRNNDVVALLIDIPQRRGVRVTFFGDTIAVPGGPARLALRAGASTVAAALPRLNRWGDRVRAEVAPVTFERSGDLETDVQRLTQAIFTQLEQFVRADPAQWYIFRHLWIDDYEAAAR